MNDRFWFCSYTFQIIGKGDNRYEHGSLTLKHGSFDPQLFEYEIRKIVKKKCENAEFFVLLFCKEIDEPKKVHGFLLGDRGNG